MLVSCAQIVHEASTATSAVMVVRWEQGLSTSPMVKHTMIINPLRGTDGGKFPLITNPDYNRGKNF